MSIAITDDHRALADTANAFLERHNAIGAARELLEANREELPAFWGDLAELGWLGLHVPETDGGSRFGLPELVTVGDALGRGAAREPFVPTTIGSGGLAAAAPADVRAQWLPGLTDGSKIGAVALGGAVE